MLTKGFIMASSYMNNISLNNVNIGPMHMVESVELTIFYAYGRVSLLNDPLTEL